LAKKGLFSRICGWTADAGALPQTPGFSEA
jgi:hypothetical protein